MNVTCMLRKLRNILLALGAVIGLSSVTHAAPPAEGFTLDNPRAQAALNVQAQATPGLMTRIEVLGTAVGEDQAGQPVLVVYLDRDVPGHQQGPALPAQIHGVGVRVEVTDKFRAFATGNTGNTAKQAAPIKLGTSGGWSRDLANGYCCGGTLGSLVQVNGVQYILSNYHVLESDITSGGNGVVATTGDSVIQPGLIDVGCNAANAQSVATLVKLGSLPNSNVDVGLAQVVSGMVQPAILGIGTLSANIVDASMRQGVKKSGRTTGLTTSTVSGLNATIRVAYDNECAGGAAFTKTFSGQIVLANKGSKFLNSGDSGSLMVENVSTNPRAVGLLFAGSNTSAIANPIGEVLGFIGASLHGTATMVGN